MTTLVARKPKVQTAVLVDDLLDQCPEPEQRPITPSAVRGVLVGFAEEVRPAIELADGSVVVLTWAQCDALATGLGEWMSSALTRRRPDGLPMVASWRLP